MGRTARERTKPRAAVSLEKGFTQHGHFTSKSILRPFSQPHYSGRSQQSLEGDSDAIIVGYDPPPPPPSLHPQQQGSQPLPRKTLLPTPAVPLMRLQECPTLYSRGTNSSRRKTTSSGQSLNTTVDPVASSHDDEKQCASSSRIVPAKNRPIANKRGTISLDCEMVGCVEVNMHHSDAHSKLRACDFVKQHRLGVGKKRRKGKFEQLTGLRQVSVAAKCSIVDYSGKTIYDTYIDPEPLKIVDLRTRWSGITKSHLANAKDFRTAQTEIVDIMKNCKILVGHHIDNDILSLAITVPDGVAVRDTSACVVLRRMAGLDERKLPSLKNLCSLLLGICIQQREHSSVEDAWATMQVYKLVENQWC